MQAITEESRSAPTRAYDDVRAIFERQSAPMTRLATLLTGSSYVAEELVQEAFVRMLEREGSSLERPDAYLQTIVVNLCKSYQRRVGLERRARPNDRLVSMPPEIDETWNALCALPFRQRAVLILRFYADLSEREIAEQLGCRLGTVKSRLHRGLAALKGRLS